MTARIVLQTFGGLVLSVRDTGEPLLVNQRKRLALIATLAADANGGVARDRLLALLWPESDSERARNALNQVVFAIRRALGDDALISEAISLRLDPAVIESDVRSFRQAIADGRFADAIAEYRGPFLDGVFLRDTPEFERWVSEMRQTLAADYARALEHEIEAAAAARRFADSVNYARLLAACDPLSTQCALLLMRALERSGDSAAALRHAIVHAAHVRAELQTEPGPQLEREVNRLRSASTMNTALAPVQTTGEQPAPDPELSVQSAESVPAVSEAAAPVLRPARRGSSLSRVLGFGVAALALGTLAIVATASRRWLPNAVVIDIRVDTGDTGLRAVRENVIRSTSQLLESTQRFRTIIADSIDESVDGVCFGHLHTTRCRAAYVVSSRFVRVGDTVSAVATVLRRGSTAERHDLVPAVRARTELLALSADVAQQLAGAVAALSDSNMLELAAGAALPRYDSYVGYSTGVEELVSGRSVSLAAKTFAAAADRDTMFAAPRLALLAYASQSERHTAESWIERHRSMLSARDRSYAAALEARNAGRAWDWYDNASEFRRLAPDDPFAVWLFGDAAYTMNHYAAADSAYTMVQRMPGWPGRASPARFRQLEARHYTGDFEGALETWRTIYNPREPAPYPCALGVLQYAAMGREASVDSLIAQCALLPHGRGDMVRDGRRVTTEDELYRRAGREYAWHGHATAAERALGKAYALERQYYERDTSANNGWLAKELSRDWPAAYRLMLDDFGRRLLNGGSCAPGDRDRACIDDVRRRFGVAAAHVGDTATALATLRWLDTSPHADSLYLVDRAEVLLAMGRRADAIRSLHDAVRAGAPGVSMHAQTELLELRGDPEFEALIASRPR